MRFSRRWLQFSLRGTLALLTALAVALGVVVGRARETREAVETIEALGADVFYDDRSSTDGAITIWLRSIFGEQYGREAIRVRVLQVRPTPLLTSYAYTGPPVIPDITFDDRGLAALGRLKALDDVLITNVPVTDAGLMQLASCSRLRNLTLVGTLVSASGIAALQARLPHCEIYFLPADE